MTTEMRREELLSEIYLAIGRAFWHIQAFEDTLAHLITIILELPPESSLKEAEEILGEIRKDTLGKLLRRAGEAIYIDEAFEPLLKRFIEDRNWLAHRMWRMYHNFVFSENHYRALMLRLQNISHEAQELNNVFSQMLIDWFKSKGLDESVLVKLDGQFDLVDKTP